MCKALEYTVDAKLLNHYNNLNNTVVRHSNRSTPDDQTGRPLMTFEFCSTMRHYDKKNLSKDLLAGVIIAAVSIPISMGYSQIAGLPAVYGLYGSVFPILIFALLSTSPQFIFGVDAAPAALIGASLLTLGIQAGSKEALAIVPVLTLFTALWLLAFYLFRAGKLVNYISTPVMGGFISGICCTIILMQLPKVLGQSSGTGELFELLEHLFESIKKVNLPSLLLGGLALGILLLSKKLIPRFPMAVVMMFAGAVCSLALPLKDYGITLLSHVEPGLPPFHLPDLSIINITQALGMSLSVALVIMAETLLAENNFALKNGYKLNDNQELLAFSAGNFAAAFTGCCPINGSVSRTSMGEQYGAKTQLTSLVAGIVMILILLFGTGFIGYLPVPVLTAIVISALLGAVEFDLAARLWKQSRTEFYIFLGAFFGVLVLGTIYGVLIGIVLSFANVIIRAADPPRGFLGVMPGHEEFFNMEEFKHTYPIPHIVIYQFNSNLFFANIAIFQNDIEGSIKEDTKAVIVDASGIGSIDMTAAKRLEIIHRSLADKDIRFYLTEHIASLNEQMRTLGIGFLIRQGAVRRTVDSALSDLGLQKPYPLDGTHHPNHSVARKRAENTIQEFVWAFGSSAEDEIEKQIEKQIAMLKETKNMDTLVHGNWNSMDTLDEDEWLEHLEAHIAEIAKIAGEDEHTIARRFEQRRLWLEQRIAKEHPELARRFAERRHILDEHLKNHRPEVYEWIIKLREELHG